MKIGEPSLTIDDVEAVASRAQHVEVSPQAREQLDRSYRFLQLLVERNVPIYGLSTGCGPLAAFPIVAGQREAFQRNLVRSHATGLGEPHTSESVRAAMLLRAHVLALGFSGVDPALVDLIVRLLNSGIHPVVRQIGSVGASGDLVELAQIALVLFGEGQVHTSSQGPHDARVALAAAGLTPLTPRFREGLALMNGTCFHSAMAALLVARVERLVSAAHIAAAMSLEALRAHPEGLDESLHRLRGQSGQQLVAARLRMLVRDSQLLRRRESVADRQDAYTVRCVPQIVGPVVDTLHEVRRIVENEINAATDNPLFIVEEQRVVHGGNFHGQPVALALDHLKTAVIELGVICERRIARLLDSNLSGGLPPFLIDGGSAHAGLRSGFMGLQYCANTLAADNAVLAAPSSVRSIPTNANNQDVVSMGVLAARHAGQVTTNVEQLVAIELLCSAQALELRGGKAGSASRRAVDAIRKRVAALTEDRPLTNDVEAACQLIRSGALVEEVDKVAGRQ
ncbi:MAG TPA: aromatic amino acid ammonia-lyase [Candidatus Acidoferrales bacterium]|nr:aromatic amino acid ammonia-lyase [Candidatus Acidoferrales bacterium]